MKAKKIFVVTGATGNVGKVVAEQLRAQGHQVRAVARSAGVSLDDLPALIKAFSGADAAFLVIPPEINAPDLRKRQNAIGVNLAEAVKQTRVQRVVFLSSVNAQYPEGTGPILGLHDMEERLNELNIPELVHLRPAYFMENHLRGIGVIAQTGFYGTAFKPDAALPMVAARDIGAKAAELLLEETFRQPRIRELLGPRDYTMIEAARLLGAAIGKPNMNYMQFSYNDARKGMIGAGLSASYADAIVEISRSFNEGKVHATERRSAQNTTPRTLEQFAQNIFRQAYAAMVPAQPKSTVPKHPVKSSADKPSNVSKVSVARVATGGNPILAAVPGVRSADRRAERTVESR
jgi:uncharacterized protein YbjT (DUF2867 family)